MKRSCACLLLLGVLVLVGCSSPAGPTAIKATAALPTPTQTLPLPTPSPIAINLTPLAMRNAWGNVSVKEFSLDLGDRYFAADSGNSSQTSITDDDQMCGSTFPMQSTAAEALQDVSSLGLINLHTGAITLLVTLPTGWNMTSCAVTGPWVIWTQGYGVSPVDWQVNALNRQTHEQRTLDRSQQPTGQPNGPHVGRPLLTASNGRVVWTTYSETTPGGTQSEMYTFDTATKTVLAADTYGPLLLWPWASWRDRYNAIAFKNLATGQQVLFSLPDATSVAFAGTSFAFTDSHLKTVTLYPSIAANPLSSYVIADTSADGGSFNEFPSLNDRLVSWASDSTSLVFDRKLMRQVQLDQTPGAGSFAGTVCSHFLVSEAPLTAADYAAATKGLPYHHVLRVIDTNTLP